jgi:type VI secretion system protein ImpA
MDTDDEKLQGFLTAAKDALDHVNAIDAVFMEKTPGYGPSLEPLQKMLGRVVSVLAKTVGTDDTEAAAEDDEGEAGGAVAKPAASGGVPGQISSRADVTAALDRIIDYYARHEPSSPLPIVLKRAKRLVGADFMTIINDLAPLGADNVKVVGGISEEGTE